MTAWVPPVDVQQSWVPQDPTFQQGFSLASTYIVVPYVNKTFPLDLNLMDNVRGGRQPFTFALSASNFPADFVCEPAGRLFRTPNGPDLIPGTALSGTITARDANNRVRVFTVATFAPGEGPLMLTNPPPDAHLNVPINWLPTITGGRPPYSFTFQGLNLPSMGFYFDEDTGRIKGAYNGVYGTGLQVVIIRAQSAASRTEPNPPIAELGFGWNLYNF